MAVQYSPSYYRATWIAIGLDAGFATAMSIRPRWLKDICSVLFSIYYIIYASEADEKVRDLTACTIFSEMAPLTSNQTKDPEIPSGATVEMLRTTWEKTTNPYVRAFPLFLPMSCRSPLSIRSRCSPITHASRYAVRSCSPARRTRRTAARLRRGCSLHPRRISSSARPTSYSTSRVAGSCQ